MREIKSTLLSLVAVFGICVTGASAQLESSVPCEQLTFAPPTYFAAGSGPRGLTTADLNGDGKTDLVAANETAGTVTVRFGDGHGNFSTSQQFTASGPSSSAIGDFNNDGNLDLVIAFRSNSRVVVRLGLGGGAFGTPVQTTVGSSPTGVITADFNHDGNLDLATSNGGTNSISVLLGNGSGAFPVATVFSISSGSGPFGLVAADLNGDGNLDIATSNRGTANLSVVFGNGVGGFGSATIFATGSLPSSIAAADFNEDGKPDLVTANEGSNSLTVRFNNRLGSFPTAVTLSSGAQPFFAVTGDLNTDGHTDIVATNQGSNSVSVFRGNGNGTFAPRMDFAVNASPRSLVVADLNDDGSPDLAAGLGSGMLAVLMNGCVQNTAPTIVSGTVTRQQDAGSSNSTIATVGDAEDPPNSLIVTINGGASASENGVSVSNMSVDAAGHVKADVSASCGATDAMFGLEVTDSEGLSATAKLTVTVTSETTPPVINNGDPIPNVTVYLPMNSPDISIPVTFGLPEASDNCTRSRTVTTAPLSGSTFNLGTSVVTVTATDDAGNIATTSFNVTVRYNFGGLLQPIDPFPALNIATGGSSIPVKFSLSGDKGLDIFAEGYPASSPIPCDENEPGTTIEETVTAGGTGLVYDPVTDQYRYVWKTSKDWKRTCRILIVRLADGSEYYAKFSFK